MCSVVSDSLQPYRLWPALLLCPWDLPGQNTGVGCCFLLGGGSFQPRDRTCISCIGKRVLYHYIAWEALYCDGWALKYGCTSVYHVCHMGGHTWENDEKYMPDWILWAFVPELVTPQDSFVMWVLQYLFFFHFAWVGLLSLATVHTSVVYFTLMWI